MFRKTILAFAADVTVRSRTTVIEPWRAHSLSETARDRIVACVAGARSSNSLD